MKANIEQCQKKNNNEHRMASTGRRHKLWMVMNELKTNIKRNKAGRMKVVGSRGLEKARLGWWWPLMLTVRYKYD